MACDIALCLSAVVLGMRICGLSYARYSLAHCIYSRNDLQSVLTLLHTGWYHSRH